MKRKRHIEVTLTPIINLNTYLSASPTIKKKTGMEEFLRTHPGERKKEEPITWKSLQSSLKYFNCSIYRATFCMPSSIVIPYIRVMVQIHQTLNTIAIHNQLINTMK